MVRSVRRPAVWAGLVLALSGVPMSAQRPRGAEGLVLPKPAELPFLEDDCEEPCWEGDVNCQPPCVYRGPAVFALDASRRRAIIVVETGFISPNRTFVLFRLDLDSRRIVRLGSRYGSLLGNAGLSPNGQFLSFTEHARGDANTLLVCIDVVNGVTFDLGDLEPWQEGQFRRTYRAVWSSKGRLVADIGIGRIDPNRPSSGIAEGERLVRIVYDPATSSVISRARLTAPDEP